jgi:hypothetical protein
VNYEESKMKHILLILFIVSIAPAFTPSERCLYFSAHFGPGIHWSTVATEEENFTQNSGFAFYTEGSRGYTYAMPLKYSFFDFSGDISAIWYFMENIGAGILYQYGNVTEYADRVNVSKTSGTLLGLNNLGFIASYWPEHNGRTGISFNVPIGLSFGTLHRLPIINANYNKQDDMQILLSLANKGVPCLGFFTGFRIDYSPINNGRFAFIISPSYDFARLNIKDDQLINYPRTSYNNELSIRFGISYFTDAK